MIVFLDFIFFVQSIADWTKNKQNTGKKAFFIRILLFDLTIGIK